jgi:hypothetical protein
VLYWNGGKLLPLVSVAQELCVVELAHLSASKPSRQIPVVLVTKIRPGALNALVGLVTTLINIATVHDGHFSPTAKITVVVTAVLNGCMLLLWGIYSLLIEKMKTVEDRNLE